MKKTNNVGEAFYNKACGMNNEDYQLEVLSDSQISAIGRTRVSEGSDDEIKNSLISQQDGIRVLAKTLNVGKIYWYIERQAVSAYKFGGDTELFEKARTFACSNSNIKYFLQLDQTRFCRDRRSSINFKYELRKHGVEVRFAYGDVDKKNSSIGIIWEAFQEAKAHADNVEHGERVLSRCITNARNRDEETGWYFKNGGLPPYGYKIHRVLVGKKKNGDPLFKSVWVENDNVVTCKINGKEVSKTIGSWAKYILIDLRLKNGWGFDRIRDHLNEIQLLAPRKKYWSDSTVCEMTRNVAYAGTGIYNKHNWSSYRSGLGLKIKDTNERVIVENAQPALITYEQHQMLQRMTKPSNRSTRPRRTQLSDSPYLLSPLFECLSCKGNVIGRNQHYKCGTYDRKGRKACGAPFYTIKQSWIEKEVIKVIGLVYDNNILERLVKGILKNYTSKNDLNDINVLRNKIEGDERAKTKLLDTLQTLDGQPTVRKVIISRIEELEESIAGCNNELSKITKPQVIPSKDQLKERIKSIVSLFERSNYAVKRAILQTFIKKMTLDPFSKCIILEGYLDPLSTWTQIDKENKKASELAEALNFNCVEHGCGGWI